MAGISNRPEDVEDENQERVEERKAELGRESAEGATPPAKNRDDEPEERGRVTNTGVGRGPEHSGH
jgi:hypothetical protein